METSELCQRIMMHTACNDFQGALISSIWLVNVYLLRAICHNFSRDLINGHRAEGCRQVMIYRLDEIVRAAEDNEGVARYVYHEALTLPMTRSKRLEVSLGLAR